MSGARNPVRVAIYTRKSVEDAEDKQFNLFVRLKSAKKVAARLAEEGIDRFPGRAWTLQSVQNCLRNVRYVGDANSHGKIVKGRQQPLLTRDLWEQAQRLLKPAPARKAERTVSPESTLFHGIVWCGHCGRPMSYRWSKKNSIGVRKYSYFVCQQDFRKATSECPVRHVSVTTVQDAMERELESVMLASTTMLVAAANATSFTPEQIVTPSKRMRQMGVSTFFVEAVAKAVEGVDISPENLAWAEEMRAKGRENHAIATRERWEKRREKRR